MTARGVYFALTEEESRALLAAADDGELLGLVEEIEERWDRDWLEEADKAWDAIHRCLTDGTLAGEEPPDRALFVLGGAQLYEGDDYLAVYIRPEDVSRVVAATSKLDADWMRRRYDDLDPADYCGPHGEEDAQYTWTNFEDVRRLLVKAAAAGRAVLFTVAA